MEANKSVFESLVDINVNEHTEEKGKLTYLSWAWAIDETFRRYPDTTYRILKFENNLPYVYDEKTGYMVFTEVTINGLTKEMWLPVMDGNNKAMLDHPYEYSTSYGKKTVEKATMFDINKTIMRCLTKNLAMFGLGLYIYAGEDLPTGTEEEKNVKEGSKKDPTKTSTSKKVEVVKESVSSDQTLTETQLKILLNLDAMYISAIEKKCNKKLNELTISEASQWIKLLEKKGVINNE